MKPTVTEVKRKTCSTSLHKNGYLFSEDACFENPCKNGATCKSEADTYFCRCPLGFDGPTCVDKGVYFLSSRKGEEI